MGRGDKKSKKGKLWRGSYGVSRNKNSIKSRLKREVTKKAEAVKVAEAKPAKPRKTARKKAEG